MDDADFPIEFKDLRDIVMTELVDVWCLGCEKFVKMNAKYASIIRTGEIASCAKCSHSK